MIELEGITKRYGNVTAVDNLHLEIPRGTVFGFIGPNGAGKTTTIKIIGGLIAPDRGNVRVCGIDLKNEPEKAKAKIGFIPDRPFLYEKLTGMEFLRFIADVYGVEEKDFHEKAGEMMERFSLSDWKDELIESYSHGMKQRLIMSAAILHDPDVFVVDEPMVGLDPAGIRMVKQLFLDLAATGKTLFVSTHTLAIAQDMCHKIGIIHRGRLVAQGSIDDLKVAAGMSDADLETAFLAITANAENIYKANPGTGTG